MSSFSTANTSLIPDWTVPPKVSELHQLPCRVCNNEALQLAPLKGMSYREFVPPAQRATTFADNDTMMPPTLSTYKDITSTQPIPGWSPPKRAEAADDVDRYEEYASAETIELSDGPLSQSGMNSSAASWIPPSMPMKNYTAYDKDDGSEMFDDHEDNQDYLEPMKEIMWNDLTYYVPESMAYAYEEGQGYPHSLEVRNSY